MKTKSEKKTREFNMANWQSGSHANRSIEINKVREVWLIRYTQLTLETTHSLSSEYNIDNYEEK